LATSTSFDLLLLDFFQLISIFFDKISLFVLIFPTLVLLLVYEPISMDIFGIIVGFIKVLTDVNVCIGTTSSGSVGLWDYVLFDLWF